MNNASCLALQTIFGNNYHNKLVRVYRYDKTTLICRVCKDRFDAKGYLKLTGKDEHCGKPMKYGKWWSKKCPECN